jgi:beta-N-acetylhexosaminidase
MQLYPYEQPEPSSHFKRMAGPVMLDVVGTALTRDDARRIAHPLTGGVILFARNYTDRTQLSMLTEQIRAVRPDVIIAVDHEGGRVQRFKTDGFTHLPSMRDIGALWDQDVFLGTQAATAAGLVLASELRACGVDLSFTPVLDIDYDRSKAIGSRAFHRDPRVVAMLAKSVAHGMSLAGMANCGKHFPGHGYVEADSHYAMPIDDRPLETLLADAQPYTWMGLALTAVMPAHVIYPRVDTRPACFSRKWLTDILRHRLGFAGAILSDDLSMHGARAVGDHLQSAQAALDAGCDMVLVCNQPEQADRVLQGLRYQPSRLSQRRLKRLRPKGKAARWSKLMRHPDYMAAREFLMAKVRLVVPPGVPARVAQASEPALGAELSGSEPVRAG